MPTWRGAGGRCKLPGPDYIAYVFLSFSVVSDVIEQWCVVLKSLAARGSLLCFLFSLPVHPCWGCTEKFFTGARTLCRRPCVLPRETPCSHSSATEDRSLLSCDVASLEECFSVAKDRNAFMCQGHYSRSNQSRIPQDVNLCVLFYFQCDKRSSNWSGKIVNLNGN